MSNFFSLRQFLFCLFLSCIPFLVKAQDVATKDKNNNEKEKTEHIKQNGLSGDKDDAVKSKPHPGKPQIKQVPKARKQPKPRVVKPRIKPKVIKVKPIKGPRLKMRRL